MSCVNVSCEIILARRYTRLILGDAETWRGAEDRRESYNALHLSFHQLAPLALYVGAYGILENCNEKIEG